MIRSAIDGDSSVLFEQTPYDPTMRLNIVGACLRLRNPERNAWGEDATRSKIIFARDAISINDHDPGPSFQLSNSQIGVRLVKSPDAVQSTPPRSP